MATGWSLPKSVKSVLTLTASTADSTTAPATSASQVMGYRLLAVPNVLSPTVQYVSTIPTLVHRVRQDMEWIDTVARPVGWPTVKTVMPISINARTVGLDIRCGIISVYLAPMRAAWVDRGWLREHALTAMWVGVSGVLAMWMCVGSVTMTMAMGLTCLHYLVTLAITLTVQFATSTFLNVRSAWLLATESMPTIPVNRAHQSIPNA